jgi:DNA polymerase-1
MMEHTGKIEHLVVVDGMGFIFRAFHAVRSGLTRADGLPTNALFGFAQMLVKVVKDLEPDACVVALDSKGKNWRHQMYPPYKSNRPEPDEALVRQLPFIQPMVEAFGLPILKEQGVEADDLIGTLVAAKLARRMTIVTSDKDLLQLVGEHDGMDVVLLDTLKDKISGPAECVEKFGVGPEQVVDVQGLMGDSTDAIPGVPGIGPKTAAELVGEFGALEEIYAHLGEVKRESVRLKLEANREQAFLSRELAKLKLDVALPVMDFSFKPRLHSAAGYLRDELEFKALATRLENGARGGAKNVEENEAPKAGSLMRARPVMPVLTPEQNSAGWGPYVAVTSMVDWKTWLAAARAQKCVAFDTETTSLDPYAARLVGVSLALGPGKACYVPVKDKRGLAAVAEVAGDLFAEPAPEVAVGPHGGDGLDILDDVLALLADPNVVKIGHNMKYDWQVVAAAAGIIPADTGPRLQGMIVNYEDTLLMSACLDGGRWNHGLDELSQRHLTHKMIAYEEVCGKGKAMVTFDKVPLDKACEYAAEDADATWRLYTLLKDRMAKTEARERFGVAYVYEQIERPLLPVVVALEARGVVVDALALKDLSADFATRMAALEQSIWAAAGHEFNVQSTQQVAVVLFDELNLGAPKHQKKRSTAVDVLEDLQELHLEGDKAAAVKGIVGPLLQYRQLAKLRSTYAEALLGQVNGQTGRVHTHYQQVGAATGRFSSSDPNLQNIPVRTEEGRKIRHAFVARPGWVVLSADYSQIELRLLADMSGSVALRKAFTDGVDIHAYTASLARNIPLAEVTKEQRRAAKFINFGLVYGMGARSLAAQIDCTVQEAQAWIDAYFARYDGVKAYMETNKQRAREMGYVETLFGRRVWLPDVMSTHAGLRAGAERAAINAPLQGSNADIIKLAMVQVHDELVLEAAPEAVDTLKTLIPEVMGKVVTLSVPLVAEVGVGPNWEEAH